MFGNMARWCGNSLRLLLFLVVCLTIASLVSGFGETTPFGTEPPEVELFDYYYDAVDNDTLKAAYETIFNWTYIESAGPARDSSTTTYIFLGVSGSFILLIIVMDFTHLIDYCKNLKNLRADLKAKKAADLEKEKLDIEHGIEDMEDVESSPADPGVTPAAKTTIDITKLVKVKSDAPSSDRPKSAPKGKTVIRAAGKGTVIKMSKKPEKAESKESLTAEDDDENIV